MMMMTTKMISMTVLVILFTSSITPTTSEAAIVLQPGSVGGIRSLGIGVVSVGGIRSLGIGIVSVGSIE